MSDKEYLAKRFDESFRLGKEVGEMLATPHTSNFYLYGARVAIDQAEENMRQAVAAFQAREKYLMKWAVEGWVQSSFTCQSPENFLKSHGVPEDIRAGVLQEIKAFREKAISRSEKP